VNRRVDPSPPLRQQHRPTIRRDGVGDGVGRELHLVSWEVLEHEGGEVSIFSEREEVLLVEGVDDGFRVVVDDSLRDDDGSSFVGGSDSVE